MLIHVFAPFGPGGTTMVFISIAPWLEYVLIADCVVLHLAVFLWLLLRFCRGVTV